MKTCIIEESYITDSVRVNLVDAEENTFFTTVMFTQQDDNIELTVRQAKELRDMLNEWFPCKQEKKSDDRSKPEGREKT